MNVAHFMPQRPCATPLFLFYSAIPTAPAFKETAPTRRISLLETSNTEIQNPRRFRQRGFFNENTNLPAGVG
jgi:hypothetical protein